MQLLMLLQWLDMIMAYVIIKSSIPYYFKNAQIDSKVVIWVSGLLKAEAKLQLFFLTKYLSFYVISECQWFLSLSV